MIKNEYIEVRVSSKTVSKLKNNGYDVSVGDIVNIKILELPINSHVRIDVICDICSEERNIRYQDFNKVTSNNTETYYCDNCKSIKSNKTCLEKNIGWYNSDNIKNSIMKKYNVDNISKLDCIKNKKKETTFKNYGVPYPAKSEIVIDKMKKTCLERYGVENAMNNEQVKQKLKESIFTKYGADNVFKSEEIKDKIKKTLIERYGVDHQMSIQSTKDKIKETCLEKYGETSYTKTDECKEKVKQTCIEKYGVYNYMQNPEIFIKNQKSRFALHLHDKINLNYQGTYEKDFLDLCFRSNITVKKGKRFQYFFEDKVHYYFSDYYIQSKNLIIEIKSSYTYEVELEKNLAKKKATIENGYNYLFIIDKNYDEFLNLI